MFSARRFGLYGMEQFFVGRGIDAKVSTMTENESIQTVYFCTPTTFYIIVHRRSIVEILLDELLHKCIQSILRNVVFVVALFDSQVNNSVTTARGDTINAVVNTDVVTVITCFAGIRHRVTAAGLCAIGSASIWACVAII